MGLQLILAPYKLALVWCLSTSNHQCCPDSDRQHPPMTRAPTSAPVSASPLAGVVSSPAVARTVHTVEELPRNPTGKLLKHVLRDEAAK